MPASSSCFAVAVSLTADSVFGYVKLRIMIMIVKYVIFHAFNSSGPLQSLPHWAKQNQIVLI